MEQGRVRQVVVLGGGTAGWMTAAALSKALGSGIELTVVESDEIGTVGVGEATIPLITHFNQQLELDENDFLRQTQGTFKLGIEFADWLRPGHRYMHAFGRFRPDVSLASFEHLWLKLHLRGETADLGEFLMTQRAAYAAKFMRPRLDVQDSPLSDLAYAFHFDASLYAAYLRRYAVKRGVTRVEGKVVDVRLDPSTGHIRSLALDGGRQVDGQFFVDCSGFRGLLIEGTLHAGYDDWSQWLPCDRAVAVPCASASPLLPYTRSTARTAGWQWRIPLQHRIGNGYVFCSKHLSEDEAASTLLGHLDGEALAEPRTLRFVTGARRKSWDRNCVAVGLASGFLEPLESTSIHLIQTAIGRLVSFFPSGEFDQADIDEYNRQTREEFEHVRDMIVLHYHATERAEPMWVQCRETTPPESLQRRIRLFRNHGRLFQVSPRELFAPFNWFQVLLGQGLQPSGYHPLVDLAPVETIGAYLADLQAGIGRCVDFMPSHESFIEQHCRAQRQVG